MPTNLFSKKERQYLIRPRNIHYLRLRTPLRDVVWSSRGGKGDVVCCDEITLRHKPNDTVQVVSTNFTCSYANT
jgi:hypothetical protein